MEYNFWLGFLLGTIVGLFAGFIGLLCAQMLDYVRSKDDMNNEL